MAPTWGDSKKAYEEACKEYEEEQKNLLNQKENKEIQAKALYVVRGAKMICNCGSHKRRINLEKSHGAYIFDKPIMSRWDCKTKLNILSLRAIKNSFLSILNPFFSLIDLEKTTNENSYENIPYFGICSKIDSDFTESINLEKEETKETISGLKCIPILSDSWDEYKEDIFMQNELLTTNSKIYCHFGGVISFVTSGQEDEIEKNEEVKNVEAIKETEKPENNQVFPNLDISDDIPYSKPYISKFGDTSRME